MHGQVEAVADLAPVQPIQTFWRAAVASHELLPPGVFAQGNAVGFDGLSVIDQLQLMGGFEHQHFVDDFAVQGFQGGGL
ncbi:hypothetical protein D3C84_796060 [compost metagenome]